MPVKWLRKALRNLETTHGYISKNDPEVATRTVMTIQGAVSQLEEFPFMGRTGRLEGTRELVIVNTRYVVIYRVKGGVVEILRVLHTSRRYPD